MAVQKFAIRGLTDRNEAEVERALSDLTGVLYASVSRHAGCAEVDFDDDLVGLDDMIRAVRALGAEIQIAG
jgi:copper chaperone CopZ